MNKLFRLLFVAAILLPFTGIGQSGCTDSTACNFDSLASEDDGSCCYANCIGINLDTIVTLEGVTWAVTDEAGDEVASGGTPIAVDLCLETGCYDIVVTDGNGMEINLLLLNVVDDNGEVLLDYSWDIQGDLSFDFSFCIPAECEGPDFDCDFFVGTSDLIYFLAEIGCVVDCTCDLSGDGTVLTDDLILFLASFGL